MQSFAGRIIQTQWQIANSCRVQFVAAAVGLDGVTVTHSSLATP